jgi:hypothetical protein
MNKQNVNTKKGNDRSTRESLLGLLPPLARSVGIDRRLTLQLAKD